MFLVVKLRKTILIMVLLLSAAILLSLLFFSPSPDAKPASATPNITGVPDTTDTPAATAPPGMSDQAVMALIEDVIAVRNSSLLKGDLETIKKFYDTKVQNGLYAYDHEVKKTKYLQNWAQKQGVAFTYITAKIQKKWINHKGDRITANFLASTEYRYAYKDRPQEGNMLRIGTYHEIVFQRRDRAWLITREWYTDPFADSLDLENIDAQENREYILSQKAAESLDLNERRLKAVEYADAYCGAADSGENSYSYNKKYKNYNSMGGDCANYASQVLHEGGRFKKTGSWNYAKDGSRAWLNAQGFKDYLIYSGRGSLIASGSYSEVLKASYKLLPGDIVAYQKNGKVKHVSVVTGADSRGYALVNCHNTDRYRVPWDLGWSDSKIKFYLIRVNY
ncbi:MAG: amidase domain-containing protein [Bacillota bacterium]